MDLCLRLQSRRSHTNCFVNEILRILRQDGSPTHFKASSFILAASKSRPIIAADTSTWIAFFKRPGKDVELLNRALKNRPVLMSPPALKEIAERSGNLTGGIQNALGTTLIEIQPGFWEGARALRAKVLANRRKARLEGCVHRIKLS